VRAGILALSLMTLMLLAGGCWLLVATFVAAVAVIT